jgi:hypothetical protein
VPLRKQQQRKHAEDQPTVAEKKIRKASKTKEVTQQGKAVDILAHMHSYLPLIL